MQSEIVYMLAIVASCFAVNFALRALPFVLFSRRGGTPPGWALRFGVFVSPVIIAGLVVYSFATLAPTAGGAVSWRTPWPYLAGAVTVALQSLRRNPLVSIVAGTALYMALANCCGCCTEPDRDLRLDGGHPFIAFTDRGIRFVDRYVKPDEVPKLLKRHHVPKTATIHILVEDPHADERALWVFSHNILGRAGYTRTMRVNGRHAVSYSGEEARRGVSPRDPEPRNYDPPRPQANARKSPRPSR